MQPQQSSSPPDPGVYDFIINSDNKSAKPGLSLPGGQSVMGRVLLVGGGLIILLILFGVVKGILAGGSNTPAFFAVAQRQQELIHLATSASEQQNISSDDDNFSATTLLSVSSSQAQLLDYMAKNKMKYNAKLLSAKVSSTTDKQLSDALAASTYSETFEAIMKDQLTSYANELKAAYNTTKGTKGREQLSSDYDQAQLLFNQLDDTSS